MSPAVHSKPSTSALAETASSTLSLLRGFTTLLASSTPPSTVSLTALPSDAPNPLEVLHTSATLLKAHVTKLSLLLINKPFTPSEIRKIISDGIANTCVPAMMTAVEICQPARFGRCLNEEVKMRVRKVFAGLESMMVEVLGQVGDMGAQEGSASGAKNGADGPGRDTLLSTGVVWEACDALMELREMGIAGIAVKKAQEYREMLEDALAELKEWAEGDENEEDDEDNDGSDGSRDDMFSLQGSMPKNQPELKETLENSLKRLKLVSTLYQALTKRRLKTAGTGMETVLEPGVVSRLDKTLDILRHIPDQADELAGAFYELDDVEARRRTEDICESGKEAIELMKLDWRNGEDGFTGWAVKWLGAVESG